MVATLNAMAFKKVEKHWTEFNFINEFQCKRCRHYAHCSILFTHVYQINVIWQSSSNWEPFTLCSRVQSFHLSVVRLSRSIKFYSNFSIFMLVVNDNHSFVVSPLLPVGDCFHRVVLVFAADPASEIKSIEANLTLISQNKIIFSIANPN